MQKVILSSKKLFTQEDLLRFGRYVDDGRGRNIKNIFWHWFNGPIPGQDRPIVKFVKAQKKSNFKRDKI